ncbi:MAG: hypothetical protein RSB51_06615, partial [Clostridia bacterium]
MQYKNLITTFRGIQEVIIKNTHDYGDVLVVDIEAKPKLHACFMKIIAFFNSTLESQFHFLIKLLKILNH